MEHSLNQLILQSRKIGFAITDRDLIIRELHGQPEIIESVMKNCQGCLLTDIFPELLGNHQDLQDILAGKLANLQLVYINRETEEKTIYLTLDELPYKDETGKIVGIVHVVQDETNKGELEQQITQNRNELRLLKNQVEKQNLELVAANNELVRMSEFKAQFVHLATYELRNPLKTLNQYLKMLVEGQVGDLTPEQGEAVKIVQKNGLRVKSMIDELINAVRLESGQIDLDIKPVDLVGVVNAVAAENASQIQSRLQVLDLQLPADLPPAKCDEDWTKQIVTNLLKSAVKFTPEGGHISIRLGLAEQPGFLQLSVADAAAGIPEQERSELFSELFQSKGASPQSGQTPGRGLDITRSLVELNRGTIWSEFSAKSGQRVSRDPADCLLSLTAVKNKQIAPFHAFIQKIVSTRPGSWFFARSLHHVDRLILKLSRGRMTITSALTGLPIFTLTATGAKSGAPRSVPLVGIRDPGCPEQIAFIASNFGQDHHPAWFYNVKANPHAQIAFGDQEKCYVAHEAEDEEYELYWKDAANTYLGYPLYKQHAGDRQIPILVFQPEERSEAPAR